MFHNILVAVDGSPDAEEALTQAIDLAESEHGRLTLLISVQNPPSIGYIGLSGEVYGEFVAGARSWAQAVLRHERDRVPATLPVTTILTDQPIRTALIKQIKQGRHDLIAMGSRGRGAVRATLLGSVSHYMLHHSSIPILIVHATHHPERGITDGRWRPHDTQHRHQPPHERRLSSLSPLIPNRQTAVPEHGRRRLPQTSDLTAATFTFAA